VLENLGAPGREKSHHREPATKPNWLPYVNAWARRRDTYKTIIKKPVFVTPTLLKRQEEEIAEAASQRIIPRSSRAASRIVGELAHRFLEVWDFAQGGGNFGDRVGGFLDRWLPQELQWDRERIETDLTEMFGCFFSSKIYSELATSRILGREVPLLMPWHGQIMEGVIDLVYEQHGLLYLADYKTDRISREKLAQSAARYRQQAHVYSQAARQSLQREVAAFKVIFLRLGEAIPVPPDATGMKSPRSRLTLS
jgi:ATP-dependent exoDNAse (exonuclease V) beta subunit